MKHKIWYDEKKGVVHTQIIGDLFTAEASSMLQIYNELLKDKPYRQVLLDVSAAGTLESRETRAAANKVLADAEISDVAYIGASSVNRMLAKVMMKLGALKTKGDFFKSTEEGLKWLTDRRKKK